MAAGGDQRAWRNDALKRLNAEAPTQPMSPVVTRPLSPVMGDREVSREATQLAQRATVPNAQVPAPVPTTGPNAPALSQVTPPGSSPRTLRMGSQQPRWLDVSPAYQAAPSSSFSFPNTINAPTPSITPTPTPRVQPRRTPAPRITPTPARVPTRQRNTAGPPATPAQGVNTAPQVPNTGRIRVQAQAQGLPIAQAGSPNPWLYPSLLGTGVMGGALLSD